MRYSIVLLLISIPLYAYASFLDTPIHGNVPPMTTSSPYSIVTSVSTANQNEIFTIRIKSILSELNVGGFIVHAHSTTQPNKILGRFTASSVGLEVSNNDGEYNTATYHAYPGTDEVELQWQAPNDYVGQIFFNATVAQDYDKFWVGVTSAPVEILQSEAVTLKSFFTSPIVRSNQSSVVNTEQISNLIYEGCGSTKSCVGIPIDCITARTCQSVATAVMVGNRYFFELQSFDERNAYVALGLSHDDRMGEDSVMECVNDGGTVRAYTSYNNPRINTRNGVPQNIISLLGASLVNGLIYCKLERQAVTTVLDVVFDLPNENYYFLLAVGSSLSNTFMLHHDLRVASTQPLKIFERPADNSIYVGCGSQKICFGMPANCVDQRSCVSVVTATIDFDDRYVFEMQSNSVGVAYISLGLSSDTLMGNDSVMECIRENGNIRLYSSWNERRTNYRDEVPQDITELLTSSFADGTIYCKFVRKPTTIVRENNFDLLTQDFHFLIAAGTSLTDGYSMVTQHDAGRLASPQPLEIIRQTDSIYEGCGTEKTCIGMPDGCVAYETCLAVVTVLVEDEERYEFELMSGVPGVHYVSFALSNDNQMGDDSVIECVVDGGNISAFHSWNNERPTFTNTRVDVSQDIFDLLDSSYTDGTIYCKFERDPSTVVRGHEFDLENRNYFFLLAIGRTVTANSITLHDLGRSKTDERIDLPGRPVSAAPYVLRISAIAIVVWLLATSSAHFLHRL